MGGDDEIDIEELLEGIENNGGVLRPEEGEPEVQPANDMIFDAVVSGIPEELMSDLVALGLSPEKLDLLREKYIGEQAKKMNRPVHEIYAEYALQTQAIVRDLQRVARGAMYPTKGRKINHRSAVDALKAQHAILDKMVYRGQELGVLPTASKSSNVRVTGGLMLGHLPVNELVEKMKDTKQEAKRLSQDYEMVSFTDLNPPRIYPEDDVIDAIPVLELPKVPSKRVKA